MSKAKIFDPFGYLNTDIEAPPDVSPEALSDATTDDVDNTQEAPSSSKEKFARLNPYFQTVLTQLASSFEKYVLPEDLYSKLAEALSIKNRGDTFSIDLLLTVGKLQPFISKKLGIKWITIERDILRPLIRKHRAEHYPESLRTLDNIPKNEWFYGEEPISSAMDILLAARRMKCEITYDEWFDVCLINYRGETLHSQKLDDIYYLLTKEFTYRFKIPNREAPHYGRSGGITP